MSESKITTKFGKGNPGKPKGATNKVTREVKEMVIQALSDAGGVSYLRERAEDPKTASAFLSLLGKVIPLQVTGAEGGDIGHRVTIEVVGVAPPR